MLAKANRLNKHGSFAYVYRKGRRLVEQDVVLTYTPARCVRVGFCVSNKVGKAVVRNKVKRRLRAAVGNILLSIRGCQAIITANASAADKDFACLDAQVERLFAAAGLIK